MSLRGSDDVLAKDSRSLQEQRRAEHLFPRANLQGPCPLRQVLTFPRSRINIASIGATRPRPGLVWYNASKAAVANATKGLAAEYGDKNIRVNSVCPLLSGTGL